MQIEYVKEGELTPKQQHALDTLNRECFGDVPQEDIDEDFIAESFALLFAKVEDSYVGRLALFQRQVQFEDLSINLGGLGGVCVATDSRRQGIASALIQEGLKILKSKDCDFACLNVDLEKKVYGVYQRAGFVMMEREISFENVHGNIVKDLGTMFVPLNSPAVFDRVMNSTTTFHYGRGYW